jgi:hypothetical protein
MLCADAACETAAVKETAKMAIARVLIVPPGERWLQLSSTDCES